MQIRYEHYWRGKDEYRAYITETYTVRYGVYKYTVNAKLKKNSRDIFNFVKTNIEASNRKHIWKWINDELRLYRNKI